VRKDQWFGIWYRFLTMKENTWNSGPSPGELRTALDDSEGTVLVRNPSPAAWARLRRAIYALINGNELPNGTRLRHRGRDRGDLEISLVTVDDEPRPKPEPDRIPIPKDLRGCHPIIRATREVVTRNKDSRIDTHRQKGVAHIRVHAKLLNRTLRFRPFERRTLATGDPRTHPG
jgi:hypothetical protein